MPLAEISSEQLIECGVDGIGVIDQDQMVAVPSDGEIEAWSDLDMNAFTRIEVGDGVFAC